MFPILTTFWASDTIRKATYEHYETKMRLTRSPWLCHTKQKPFHFAQSRMAKEILWWAANLRARKVHFALLGASHFTFLNLVPVIFDSSCCFRHGSSPSIGAWDCSDTLSCDQTNLNESSTFFLEYVLEDSNDADYFTKHVAGFTFASSKDKTDNDENMDTTLWYSNRVSLFPCSLNYYFNFCFRLGLSLDRNRHKWSHGLNYARIMACGWSRPAKYS